MQDESPVTRDFNIFLSICNTLRVPPPVSVPVWTRATTLLKKNTKKGARTHIKWLYSSQICQSKYLALKAADLWSRRPPRCRWRLLIHLGTGEMLQSTAEHCPCAGVTEGRGRI